MKILRLGFSSSILLLALGCGPNVETPSETDGETDGSTGTGPGTTETPNPDPSIPQPSTTTPDPSTTTVGTVTETAGTVTTDPSGDTSSGSTGEPACEGDCPPLALDLVVVVDNSAGMGPAQAALAQSAWSLVDGLRSLTGDLDVRVHVTTTDFGNPLCTPFEPAGYDPARGAPISSPCVDRLDDFVGLGAVPDDISSVCIDACPVPVTPQDPFVSFTANDDNIDGGDVVAALGCLLPQGNVGCGFESPLENMLQALNPSACWNQPGGCDGQSEPFLREDAALALIVVTNEYDCSVSDFSIMEDPGFQNVNPDTGMPSPSSAICWNAGVTCQGPDANGVYTDCTATDGDGLQPISRYTGYLVDELVGVQGKDVYMAGVFGVPLGGPDELVIREWQDGQYPAGDILPEPFAQGVTAADQTFNWGIGPGCTQEVGNGEYIQALPPVRMAEVCQALDVQDGMHCCLQSVCDDDYAPAMQCLVDMISADLAG